MAKQKPIAKQIQQLILNSQKTDYYIAKEAGIQGSTFQRVKEDGWGTQIETAEKILSAMGYNLVIQKQP